MQGLRLLRRLAPRHWQTVSERLDVVPSHLRTGDPPFSRSLPRLRSRAPSDALALKSSSWMPIDAPIGHVLVAECVDGLPLPRQA